MKNLVLRSFFNDFNDIFESESFMSNTNLQSKETDKAFLVALDLPGVKDKDLNIDVVGQHLVVKAKRKNEFSDNYRELSKSFGLPQNIDATKIQAHLEDGVLKITIPKLESKSSKVQIDDSNKKWWE